ncbi:MAG TPA: hypothetical protein VII49_13005 [Rhizomicrobium sp.]
MFAGNSDNFSDYVAIDAAREGFSLARQAVGAKRARADQRFVQGSTAKQARVWVAEIALSPPSFDGPVANAGEGEGNPARPTAPGAAIRHAENHRPFDQNRQEKLRGNPHTECVAIRISPRGENPCELCIPSRAALHVETLGNI